MGEGRHGGREWEEVRQPSGLDGSVAARRSEAGGTPTGSGRRWWGGASRWSGPSRGRRQPGRWWPMTGLEVGDGGVECRAA